MHRTGHREFMAKEADLPLATVSANTMTAHLIARAPW
jgi:hypothetical protein